MSLDSSRRSAKNTAIPKTGSLVYEIGKQRVILGDCLTRLRNMPDGLFEVVVTSPPYNVGIAYKTYDDRRPLRDYLSWLFEVGKELRRVLKDDGSFFLNVGGTNSDAWLPMDLAEVFRDLFRLQNQIVWVKSVAIGDETQGHFKPINSKRYLNHCHEMVFHFTKSGHVTLDRLAIGVSFTDKTNISRWNHAFDKRCAGNVWFVPYRTVQSKRGKFNHPAGFPVDLPKRCLQLHGQLNASVLDPFVGGGSTLVAAEELGMHGTGIELDEYYVDIACRRLEEAALVQRRRLHD